MQVQQAPAKLTLSLHVTGVRTDGYHLIDAEMVNLDLVDVLQFEAADESSVSIVLELPAMLGLPVTAGPDNLVLRALADVGRHARVRLFKRIPAGAGLGGGSADAAAVYRWAGRTSFADVTNASRLGADIPFCIVGGRARVTGIGEIIEPLPSVVRTYTLCIPPFGVSTPAVYRMWDELGGPIGADNDLEQAALAVEPRLVIWRDRLWSATGLRPTLAGSGSTWFVPGDFPGPERFVVSTVRPT